MRNFNLVEFSEKKGMFRFSKNPLKFQILLKKNNFVSELDQLYL